MCNPRKELFFEDVSISCVRDTGFVISYIIASSRAVLFADVSVSVIRDMGSVMYYCYIQSCTVRGYAFKCRQRHGFYN